jgi:hypothetical protein
MPTYVSGQQRDVKPDGEYDFIVEGATLGNSKNGNQRIELQNRIGDILVFDYLVFDEKSYWKIDQFRRAIGEVVLPGEVVEIKPSDLEGKTGRCTLITEIWQGKARNKIGSYIEKVVDELPMK